MTVKHSYALAGIMKETCQLADGMERVRGTARSKCCSYSYSNFTMSALGIGIFVCTDWLATSPGICSTPTYTTIRFKQCQRIKNLNYSLCFGIG